MSSVRRQSLDRPFSLWPGVVIVLLQWLVTFGPGFVMPASTVQFFGMMGGPLLGLLLLFGWWLKVSDEPWRRKLLVVLLPVPLFVGAVALSDPSIQQAVYIFGLPYLCLAFVGWLWLHRALPLRKPLSAWVAIATVVCGGWVLVRVTGVDGDMSFDFVPRWRASPEDQLLEAAVESGTESVPDSGLSSSVAFVEPSWPGLRGANRDAVVAGVHVATGWVETPPVVIWKHPVGPGWSSFAVAGDLLFTQEQRGDDELVSAYSASTGLPVWQHGDEERFWESLAGAGPRATPTVHQGRVYALGGTGLLNALDALDGRPIWQRDLRADTGATLPDWGFAASPLVTDGLVVVHGGAPNGKALVAYDAESGEPRWFAPAGALSYCSVQDFVLEGQRQLLIVTGDGATSVGLDGAVLWKHDWPVQGASRVVQPARTDDGDVVLGTGFGVGLRRITVSRQGDAWSTSEVWTSKAMKPYYNDLVVHKDHAYGFDNRILAAVNLATGDQAWKGGRYGNGQLLLLPDQDLLLVVSDRGELALVRAVPDGFEELATFQAIQGKTWNHLALVDGVLYVRNAEEMAAVRLPS